MKDYFQSMTLENSRVMFSLKSKMTRSIKTHYSSDKGYASDLWNCAQCENQIDSVSHLKICPFFAPLRQKYDLQCDFQLTEYFKEILKIRDEAQAE